MLTILLTDAPHASASAIPSQEELASDTAALISSIKMSSRIFVTSAACRAILADLLLSAREIVANAVEQVRKTAETVEQVAEAAETTLKPELEPTFAKREQVVEQSIVKVKMPKEVALDRLEQVRISHARTEMRLVLITVPRYSFKRKRLHSTTLHSAFCSTCSRSTRIGYTS